MHLDAILTESEDLNGRSSQRRSLKLSVGVQAQTGNWTSVVVRNIADRGLLLETDLVALEIGDSITVALPEMRVFKAEVAWANAPFFGCRLEGSFSSAEIAAALLRSEPANDFDVQNTSEIGRLFRRNDDLKFGPRRSFAIVFGLSMTLWGLIGLALYLT